MEIANQVKKRQAPEKPPLPLELLLSAAASTGTAGKKGIVTAAENVSTERKKQQDYYGVIKKAIVKDGYVYLTNKDDEIGDCEETIKLRYKSRKFAEDIGKSSK